jgi:site-specific DNA-methyltransferase (adenine-specific)
MTPYYSDDAVSLYHGDLREVLPQLGIRADVAICDPPYEETEHTWDRWPAGWPTVVAGVTSSMWCFGSMRMFIARAGEFADWTVSHDVAWAKPNPTGARADRFRRAHESVVHMYRGLWQDVHHQAVKVDAVRTSRGVQHRARRPRDPKSLFRGGNEGSVHPWPLRQLPHAKHRLRPSWIPTADGGDR